MNGASLISGLLFDPDQTLGTNWKIVGTGDFNGDGKPDLVWQHLVNKRHQGLVDEQSYSACGGSF
jgi:hypothetical protein